ncbi:TetR/AcrR family transcriptional regulator [Nocardia sp. NBC_01009]|uniref:TetR/AcrR family transcriptional regulator n=1 Tax=Nocardia sp. NBC_01009 TaxID=2975996 RepID=UPI00386A8AA5|nr:TetR/AcrR family transcriptional regulator [Nocardia sp. NBC_01009]
MKPPELAVCDTSKKSTLQRVGPEVMRQRLVQAATDLFLAEGFAATSIERIAEEAGCSKGMFSTHFRGKAVIGHDVADILCDRAIQRIQRFQPTDTNELVITLARWTSILVTRPGWASLERTLADLDPDNPATARRIARMREAVAELLTTAMNPGIPRRDADTVVMLLLSLVIGIADQHLHGLGIPGTAIRPHIELVLRSAVPA